MTFGRADTLKALVHYTRPVQSPFRDKSNSCGRIHIRHRHDLIDQDCCPGNPLDIARRCLTIIERDVEGHPVFMAGADDCTNTKPCKWVQGCHVWESSLIVYASFVLGFLHVFACLAWEAFPRHISRRRGVGSLQIGIFSSSKSSNNSFCGL